LYKKSLLAIHSLQKLEREIKLNLIKAIYKELTAKIHLKMSSQPYFKIRTKRDIIITYPALSENHVSGLSVNKGIIE
jgi:hypothetical protein